MPGLTQTINSGLRQFMCLHIAFSLHKTPKNLIKTHAQLKQFLNRHPNSIIFQSLISDAINDLLTIRFKDHPFPTIQKGPLYPKSTPTLLICCQSNGQNSSLATYKLRSEALQEMVEQEKYIIHSYYKRASHRFSLTFEKQENLLVTLRPKIFVRVYSLKNLSSEGKLIEGKLKPVLAVSTVKKLPV